MWFLFVGVNSLGDMVHVDGGVLWCRLLVHVE